MNRRYRILILSLLILVASRVETSYAQITVSGGQTASALAQKLAGQGVTITNATLHCASVANGFFNCVGGILGLDSGIVLTTGLAATSGTNYGINGYSAALASNNNGLPGDAMLTTLAGQATIDACALEFDVTPNGDSIKFSYVFSSEEYMNAVCGPYNDAFAFFISGPGITGNENMALVPGTSIPVTINSINNGIPGSTGHLSNCTSMGAGSPFTAYYIDNTNGLMLTHKGLTSVLQAQHAVTPCTTYHLKLVIADAGDPLYDSGVFLKAGSLSTGTFNVNALAALSYDTASLLCVKGCLPGRFRVRRSETSTEAKTVRLTTAGTAISGVDYSAIPDSVVIPANQLYTDLIINGLPTPANGPKSLQLFIHSPYFCTGTNSIVDSATIVIYDTLHISMLTPDTTICGNEQVPINVAGDSFLFYNWTPAAGLSNAGISNPIVYTSATTTYQVTAVLPGTSCPSKTAQITFNVKLTPQILLRPDTTVCYNTSVTFDATTTQPNSYYSYSWTGPANFTSTALDPEINETGPTNTGSYTITVRIDTNNCTATASENLAVTTPDTPSVVSPVLYCLNKSADSLRASGTRLLWYTGSSATPDSIAPIPPTNDVSTYTYYVTQTLGNCESPKAGIEVEVKKCCDGNIFIPNAFTPNNDGLNDKFEAIMDYGYRINSMYIFNRWGQIVYSGLKGSWDGNFGGAQSETGTYFYKISFGCILGGSTERAGDVTLIR